MQNRDTGKDESAPDDTRGFPSPAEDYTDRGLDLNEHLVPHPAATFFMRAAGDATDGDIRDGDLLVVDRSLDPGRGDLVVATGAGELVVTRLDIVQANTPEEAAVWGVCTHLIRRLGRGGREAVP
mgnify:CR=1 FL=1